MIKKVKVTKNESIFYKMYVKCEMSKKMNDIESE